MMHQISDEEHSLLHSRNEISGEPFVWSVPTGSVELKVYSRRWIILINFASLAFLQGMIWNTWGPISSSSLREFPNWTDGSIALLSNWGYITFLLFAIPTVWLINIKGFRFSTLCGAFLVVTAACLRIMTSDPQLGTWLIHIAHFLNGVAGVILLSLPARLSSLWFPANQRTTSTAITCFANNMGSAFSFIVGPYLVGGPDSSTTPSPEVLEHEKREIKFLLYIHFLMSTIGFICAVAYFPEKPRLPPSVSASVKRTDNVLGMKAIVRHRNVWLVNIAYSVSTSLFGTWSSVMYINLQMFDVNQKEVGWLGCFATLGGSIGGILAARIVDFLGGRMKPFLIISLSLCTACFVWFALLCMRVIPFSTVNLYIPVIVGGSLNMSLQPVFIELGAELGYPISEEVVGCFMNVLYCIVAMIFLFVYYIPHIGYAWVNWCLIVGTVVGIPIVAFIQGRHTRSMIDQEISSGSSVN